LEVQETIDYLTGGPRDERLHGVVMALCQELLLLSGMAETEESAAAAIVVALDGGHAAEAFQKMVAALGGRADFVERAQEQLPRAPIVKPVYPEHAGFVSAQRTRDIGMAVVTLGGGRHRADQGIDHAVGFAALAGLGEEVGPERPLGIIHARSEHDFTWAKAALQTAYRLSNEAPPAEKLIYDRILA
jgi:thymidine phosphorylase